MTTAATTGRGVGIDWTTGVEVVADDTLAGGGVRGACVTGCDAAGAAAATRTGGAAGLAGAATVDTGAGAGAGTRVGAGRETAAALRLFWGT